MMITLQEYEWLLDTRSIDNVPTGTRGHTIKRGKTEVSFWTGKTWKNFILKLKPTKSKETSKIIGVYSLLEEGFKMLFDKDYTFLIDNKGKVIIMGQQIQHVYTVTEFTSKLIVLVPARTMPIPVIPKIANIDHLAALESMIYKGRIPRITISSRCTSTIVNDSNYITSGLFHKKNDGITETSKGWSFFIFMQGKDRWFVMPLLSLYLPNSNNIIVLSMAQVTTMFNLSICLDRKKMIMFRDSRVLNVSTFYKSTWCLTGFPVHSRFFNILPLELFDKGAVVPDKLISIDFKIVSYILNNTIQVKNGKS